MPGSPFNPATGERAPVGAYPSKGTTLALFQVVGDDPQDPETADTHDNYVVCRGYEADFDPNFRYLHDPYTKPDTTPINVAKPYSIRGTFPYTQGQVIVAARIKGRLGYNAGKATAPTVGQPEDLEDELELLLDDAGVGIAWLDINAIATSGPVLLSEGSKSSVSNSDGNVDLVSWSATPQGSLSSLGFTFNNATGVLTYSGASKTFLHWGTVLATPDVTSHTSLVVVEAAIDVSKNGSFEVQWHQCYWPYVRSGFSGLEVGIGSQSIPFCRALLAEDGDEFTVKVSVPTSTNPYDIDFTQCRWAISEAAT